MSDEAREMLEKLFFEKLSVEKMLVDLVRSARGEGGKQMAHTKEFEAACNGEIDILAPHEVTDDILEELDEWSEIGWVVLECGCLVGPEGMALHGPASKHLENKME
jgi:hypothetical protein